MKDKLVIEKDTLTGIGDAIREAEGTMEQIPVPELKRRVAGVYRAGVKSEYDKMWDKLQNNGGTTYGSRGHFNGFLFSFRNFYPKYDIQIVGDASYLFYAWETKPEHLGDFKGRLDECGVVLDTSGATSITSMFNYSHMDNIPTIDCTGLTVECNSVFANSWGDMKTIERIVVKENVKFTNWFNNAQGLVDVLFEGVIGQSGLNLQWSQKLSKASITSVINALSVTTSGLAVTLSKTAVNVAFETVEGAADGLTCAEWTALANTKSNWIINLV